MADLVGHFAVFAVIGIVFLMLPLLAGWFLRPKNPTVEKLAAYECGEPTIGSSYVQFDLRFYVVALLFIIFDVEVAFFFPWATIYGTATQLADHSLSTPAREELSAQLLNFPQGAPIGDNAIGPETAYLLALTGFVDILVFFGVLLVGFAYVWKRGDLDWVRATASPAASLAARGATAAPSTAITPVSTSA